MQQTIALRKIFKIGKLYRIRLERNKRFKYPFYYIVVTNIRDGIIKTIGYYNPIEIPIKNSYKLAEEKYYNDRLKIVGIDFANLSYWLFKGAVFSSTLFFILSFTGLIKNYNSHEDFHVKYINDFYNQKLNNIDNNNVKKFKRFKHFKVLL